MLRKLLVPLLLLVSLPVFWLYNTNSQNLPPLPYILKDQADSIEKTQLLIAGNHWVQKLSAHAQMLEEAFTDTIKTQIFYGKKNFSLKRLTHLLKSQQVENLPEIVVWLGSDSELIEESYHPEEATAWLLDYQKWLKTGSVQSNYRIYELSPFINEENWQKKSEIWWQAKHLTHLKLFEAELKHLLHFLSQNQIRLIAITTPFSEEKEELIAKQHPRSFTPFANEILRQMSDQYGFMLYDWANRVGQNKASHQQLAETLAKLIPTIIEP